MIEVLYLGIAFAIILGLAMLATEWTVFYKDNRDFVRVYGKHNLCEQDIKLLQSFHNCTVTGHLILPSGFTIPEPLKGCHWHVHEGIVFLKENEPNP